MKTLAGKRPLGRPRYDGRIILNCILNKRRGYGLNSSGLVQWQAVAKIGSVIGEKFYQRSYRYFLRKDNALWS
jgi:hypothetical protein